VGYGPRAGTIDRMSTGFRRSPSGGSKGGPFREGAEGFVSGALFSKAQILHLMKTEFARARRHRLPLGCLCLQVDRMAQLVDLHGVALRSVVREALTRLVREKTRGADTLGMVTEDRYLLLLPHADIEQTRKVGERLRQLFGDHELVVDGRVLELKLSVGVAAIGDQQTMFFDTMVNQAETALDWAMRHGGDRTVSFGETQLLGGPGPRPEDMP
jgi:diguanylate cyclase (GGDEF)-like protein